MNSKNNQSKKYIVLDYGKTHQDGDIPFVKCYAYFSGRDGLGTCNTHCQWYVKGHNCEWWVP